MQKQKKRIYIPDVYVGLLFLPVIAIIAIISELLLPWITALIEYFKK
jgi:hypothetical protein